jgi:transposase InsO family protein
MLAAKPVRRLLDGTAPRALSAQVNEAPAPTTAPLSQWYLLHSRLGHVSARRLQQLMRGSMALGITAPAGNPEEQAAIKDCKHCLEGKMHRAPIPKTSTARASDPLYVVHTDVCGPLPEPAMGTGALYFVSFIDEYSSFATVYLLRTKDQALDAFRQYKAWAENYTGYSIKHLQSDGGGEYISGQFTSFLYIMGIQRHLTVARTPQQNGVAERFNRTIMDSARSMLHATGLPGEYWGDAVSTAVYVRNRLPTRALNGVTPYEAWRGEKPNLSHLRVWGCLTHVHVHRVKRNKLAPRARACVFVGYAPEAKGWKLYDPTAKRHLVARDVTFHEQTSGTEALVGGGAPASSSPSPSSPPPPSSSPPPVVPVPVPAGVPPSSITSNVHEGVEFDDEFDEEADSDSEALPESRADHPPPPVSPSSDLLSGREALSHSEPSSSGSPQSSGEAPRSSQAAPAVGAASVPLVEPSTGSPAAKVKKAKGQRELDRLRDSTPSNPGYVAASPLVPRYSSSGGERALAASVSDERREVVNTESSVMEPRTYAEAMTTPEREQWEQAMREELASIVANHTWTLVPLPAGRKAVGCKWVLKIKRKADGSIDRFKARLVAKGFLQKEGLDYTETFAPVARMPSLRALLAIAAAQDLEVHQMDVRTAFLNGELEEDIYMEQPQGFVASGSQAQLVYKLHRSLYGLKQAGRAWYKKIDAALSELGLRPTASDSCIYVLHEASTTVYILLYVDDLLLISNDLGRLSLIKAELSKRFDMKDLGEAQFILGIQIQRDRARRRISLSQSEYIKTILNRFDMAECKPVRSPMAVGTKLLREEPSTPSVIDHQQADPQEDDMAEVPYAQAVGALMYAAMGTRPDIAYCTTSLSQFMQKPTRTHWTALKRVLRYLKGTQQARLLYQPSADKQECSLDVHGYCDSDWGNDVSDRRSITGWAFLLHGCAVSWQSRKQRTTALSSVEAEYMAAAAATKEAVWWRQFLTELGVRPTGPTALYSDSQGSIALAKNPDHHDRTKHIDMRYHFIREQLATQAIRMEFVGTEWMLADALTKPLGTDRHEVLVGKLGLVI